MANLDDILHEVEEVKKLYDMFLRTRVPDTAKEAKGEKWQLKVEQAEFSGKPYDPDQMKLDEKILISRKVAMEIVRDYEQKLVQVLAKGQWISWTKIDAINTTAHEAIVALKTIFASAVASIYSLTIKGVRDFFAALLKAALEGYETFVTTPNDLFDPLWWSNKSDQVFAAEEKTAKEVAKHWTEVKTAAAKTIEIAKKATWDWVVKTAEGMMDVFDSAAALKTSFVSFGIRDAAIYTARSKAFKPAKQGAKRYKRRKRARR